MPVTPYQAKILEGAQAYSAPFGTPWGVAQAGAVVTVDLEWLGYGKIVNPPWPRNMKPYWVKLQYLQEYVPDPGTGGVVPVRSVVEMDDGSVWEATQFTRVA